MNRKRVRRLYCLDRLQLRIAYGCVDGNIWHCIVGWPRFLSGQPNDGAWLLCMIPWRTGDLSNLDGRG
mgnify:CR=1 FL=1